MHELVLSLDELRDVAEQVTEDLQREANQSIRKKDWEQGMSALGGMEAIKTFVYACELRAGAYRVRGASPLPKHETRIYTWADARTEEIRARTRRQK